LKVKCSESRSVEEKHILTGNRHSGLF